jgi:methionyl-tRNA formyltransferase
MQMDEGLDTGPVLLQRSMPIHTDDTAGTLQDRLAELGAKLAVQVLDTLEADGLRPTPQSAQGVTYAPKFEKQEARIDWREPAAAVSRRVRASNPSPGAVARLHGIDVKIWRCIPVSDQGNPGEILEADAQGIMVACGEGAVLADALQRPGGKRLSAGEFLRGFQLARGERFDV